MEGMFSRALLEAREAHKTLEEEKATRDAEARPVMVSCMAVLLYIVPCWNSPSPPLHMQCVYLFSIIHIVRNYFYIRITVDPDFQFVSLFTVQCNNPKPVIALNSFNLIFLTV
jgi:hypothetical protein